jgi:dynein heavy chain
MKDLLARLPQEFELVALGIKAKPLLQGPDGPYIVVALQECSRMNALLAEMRRSLEDLDKGLKGQLNMTQEMEDLANALKINQWPGRDPFSRCRWQQLAWPSNKSLSSQFQDLLARVNQLKEWTRAFETPSCLWLSGLFNPMSYLTALRQIVSRKCGKPLDKMTIETHVTNIYDPEKAKEMEAIDGAYIHGMYLEGGRWPRGEETGDPFDVAGTPCAGSLAESAPKELLSEMPVIYVKVVPQDEEERDDDIYQCPVYYTSMRGPTYLFPASLRTSSCLTPEQAVLRGTAMILSDD